MAISKRNIDIDLTKALGQVSKMTESLNNLDVGKMNTAIDAVNRLSEAFLGLSKTPELTNAQDVFSKFIKSTQAMIKEANENPLKIKIDETLVESSLKKLEKALSDLESLSDRVLSGDKSSTDKTGTDDVANKIKEENELKKEGAKHTEQATESIKEKTGALEENKNIQQEANKIANESNELQKNNLDNQKLTNSQAQEELKNLHSILGLNENRNKLERLRKEAIRDNNNNVADTLNQYRNINEEMQRLGAQEGLEQVEARLVGNVKLQKDYANDTEKTNILKKEHNAILEKGSAIIKQWQDYKRDDLRRDNEATLSYEKKISLLKQQEEINKTIQLYSQRDLKDINLSTQAREQMSQKQSEILEMQNQLSQAQENGVMLTKQETDVLSKKVSQYRDYIESIGEIKSEKEKSNNLTSQEIKLNEIASRTSKDNVKAQVVGYDKINAQKNKNLVLMQKIKDMSEAVGIPTKDIPTLREFANLHQKVSEKGKLTTQEYTRQEELRKRLTDYVKEYEQITNRSTEESRRITRAVQQTSSSLRTQIPLAERVSDSFRQAVAHNMSIEKIVDRVSFVMVAKTAYRLFDTITRGLADSVKLSIEFEERMARIYGLVRNISDTMEQDFADSVLHSMRAYGQSVQDATDALYDIISAQIDAEGATKVLDASLKLAVAEFTDIGTATDITTTVLKAYNLEASQAADVTDLLSSIVEYGRTTLEELAPAFGTIASVAGQFDIQMEDVGASIALMTQNGMKAKPAMTALRQLILNLANPTDRVRDVMHRYRLELDLNTIRTKGLVYVAEQLKDLREEDLVTIASSRRGVMALTATTKDAAYYQEIYNNMIHRSGTVQQRYERQMETTEMKNKRLRGEVQAMAVTFTTQLLPAINALISVTASFVKGMSLLVDLLTQIPALTAAAVISLVSLNKVMLGLVKTMAALVIANKFLLAVVAVGALITAVGAYMRRSERLAQQEREANQRYSEHLKQKIDGYKKEAEILDSVIKKQEELKDGLISQDEFDTFIDKTRESIPGLEDDLDGLKDKTRELREEMESTETLLFKLEIDSLEQELNDAINDLDSAKKSLTTPFISIDGYVSFDNDSEIIDADDMNAISKQVDYMIKEIDDDLKRIGDRGFLTRLFVGDTKRNLQTTKTKITELFNIIIESTSSISDKEDEITKIVAQRMVLLDKANKQHEDTEERKKQINDLEKEHSITLERAYEIVKKTNEEGEDAEAKTVESGKQEKARLKRMQRTLNLLRSQSEEYATHRAQLDNIDDKKKEDLKNLEEQLDNNRWIEADYEKMVKLIKEQANLKKENLENDYKVSVLQRNIAESMEKISQLDLAESLGIELDLSLPDKDTIEGYYDDLIGLNEENTEEAIKLEIEKAQALETIRRAGLDDYKKIMEDTNKAIKDSEKETKAMLEAGQELYKEHYGQLGKLAKQSTEELNEILEDVEQEPIRIAIEAEIERRQIQETVEEINREIDKAIKSSKAEGYLPLFIGDQTKEIKQYKAFTEAIAKLKEEQEEKGVNLSTEIGELEEAQEDLRTKNRIESAQMLASQLGDIWNSYTQMRQEQIAREFDAATKAAREKAEAEMRSQAWLNAELEKAEEERLEKEKKIAREEQIMNISKALMNVALGVTKAISMANIPLAVTIGALGAIQVGMIAQQGFAKGGYTGGGTVKDHTGERVAGVVHEKEFVFNKSATKGNVDLLYSLQEMLSGGKILSHSNTHFAEGGYTGQAVSMTSTVFETKKLEEKIDSLTEVMKKKDLNVQVVGKFIDDVEISRKASRGNNIRARRAI